MTRQVFVLTDGQVRFSTHESIPINTLQVSNSSACIQLVRAHSTNARVFSLGVGSAADRHLVKGLARAGQGTSAFTNIGEAITGKVVTLLKHALQPSINSVRVDWGVGEGEVGEVEPVVETEMTLFGYGPPKARGNGIQRNQAPAKVPLKSYWHLLDPLHQVPAIYDGSRLLVYKLLPSTLPIGAK